MKKLFFLSATILLLSSCGNSATDNEAKSNDSDSVGLTNPSALDTVKHPSGVDNSSVISTDTAAMNVQNTIKKADSISKRKSK